MSSPARPENPLDPSPAHDARVLARARHLWIADGSPADRLNSYLEQADELVRMEEDGNPGQLPNPMSVHSAPGPLVEEASIQDNLGELPGGSSAADQGERRETPMTRDQLRHRNPTDEGGTR